MKSGISFNVCVRTETVLRMVVQYQGIQDVRITIFTRNMPIVAPSDGLI